MATLLAHLQKTLLAGTTKQSGSRRTLLQGDDDPQDVVCARHPADAFVDTLPAAVTIR